MKVYPDARLVQTHRDPIKCMASTTNLMGTLYSMRSDQPFHADIFESIIMGEATSQRLEQVIAQREAGVVPAGNIADSRYQDLMDDPLGCIESIYAHFDMELSATASDNMAAYLAQKPKGKHGAHNYEVNESKSRERTLFKRYQALYQVPDEI